MAIVVADLVAKIRADTSELQQGTQAAKQQLQGVQQQADQTARALEIMAGQYAKLHGGTAAGALEMFNRAGVQPTAAAMAEAAKAAEKTSAAVQSAVPHTQAVARATADVQKGWTSSESSVLRFASALVGVNLGISLIAGAGRAIHQVFSDVVERQTEWERGLVTIHGIYGAIGSRIEAISQAQAAAPGLAGTQLEYLQANLAASYLSRRYGLSQNVVTGLTSSAGAASFALGYNEQQRADLQARALAFAEGGGSSLRPYGIEGDPLSISRRLGGVSEAQLGALTPAQQRQAQTLIATQGLSQIALFGEQGKPGLLARRADLEKALTQTQSQLQTGLEGNANQVPPAFQLSRRGLPANPQAVAAAADLEKLQQAAREVQDALTKNAAAMGDHTKRLVDAAVGLEKMGVTVGTATFRLLGFTGSLEDSRSIARGDVAASAQAAVAGRARSALPVYAMPAAERAALATNDAWQQAKQNFIALQAQQNQDNGIREWLQGQGSGGEAAIADAQRREGANKTLKDAETADGLAQLRVAEQQSNVEEISLRYRERALNVERETIGLRRTETQLSMDNLRTTEAVLRAQQAALPSGAALQNLSYEQQRTALLAQERQARLLRGQDVSDLPTFDELIGQSINQRLDLPGVARRALEAGQGVAVAGQAAEAGGIAAGLAQIPITTANLQLALAQLADDPARLAAEGGLLGAQGTQLRTGRNVRTATTALANVNLTVNVGGTVQLADDAIKAAADQASDLVEQALREGLAESDQVGVPASPQLVGARR